MREVEEIDQLIKLLKTARAEHIKRSKISTKTREAYENKNVSAKRVQSLNADLNWQCMTADKRLIDIARAYEKMSIHRTTGEKEYSPSAFHTYKY